MVIANRYDQPKPLIIATSSHVASPHYLSFGYFGGSGLVNKKQDADVIILSLSPTLHRYGERLAAASRYPLTGAVNYRQASSELSVGGMREKPAILALGFAGSDKAHRDEYWPLDAIRAVPSSVASREPLP
jgi:hypothetical protein